MSVGPWKKHKCKKLKGIDGNSGYTFVKKISTGTNGCGLVSLPKLFAGKRITIIIVDEENQIEELNKEPELTNPFK